MAVTRAPAACISPLSLTNDGALIRPPRRTGRNMATKPEMSRNTPDRNAGVLSGHGCLWPVNARADVRCRGLILPLPSDPSRQARNASLRGSAELAGLPVSEVGLTTRLDGEPKGAIAMTLPLAFRWTELKSRDQLDH